MLLILLWHLLLTLLGPLIVIWYWTQHNMKHQLAVDLLQNANEPVNHTREVPFMENALSREELDALLRDAPAPVSQHSGHDALIAVTQAATKALCGYLDATKTWVASDPIVTSWNDVTTATGISAGTPLLVVEVRTPGGPMFIAASTLTTCRLDEVALQGQATEWVDVAFLGWRRVVERLVVDVCVALSPTTCASQVYLQSLAPRRWDLGRGDLGLGVQQTPVVIITLSSDPDAQNKVVLLIPATTVAQLLDTDNTADSSTSEQPTITRSDSSTLGIVADVPLHMQLMVTMGKVLARDVAAWGPGSVVPLTLSQGEPVQIMANGIHVADGELMIEPDGKMAIKLKLGDIATPRPDAG